MFSLLLKELTFDVYFDYSLHTPEKIEQMKGLIEIVKKCNKNYTI